MMVGKLEKVLSWADEVEQEEEEEAQININEKQKPNPFGSARPREVVLQERGIDWRKIHGDSQASSNFRSVDQKMKENIPAIDRNCTDQKVSMKSWNLDSEVSPNRSPGLIAPPLKYPPRAYLPFLYQYQNQIGRKNEAAGTEHLNASNDHQLQIGGRRREPQNPEGYFGHNNNWEGDDFDRRMVKSAGRLNANGNYKNRGKAMNSKTYNDSANRGRR